MSELDPVLLDHNGHVPTALELIADWLVSVTPGVAINDGVYLQYKQEATGMVRYLEMEDGEGVATMGKNVAWENPTIIITVLGDVGKVQAPKDEAVRIKYKLAALVDYTSRGLTAHVASHVRIQELGKDGNDRTAYTVTAELMVTPSYA